MTISEIALSILAGIYGAESSWGTDPRAWERARHSAGPLQVTKICCEDFNRRNPDRPFCWPDDFLGDTPAERERAMANSRTVYLDHCQYFGEMMERVGKEVTPYRLALIWRYGYKGARRQKWRDTFGYWGMVKDRNERIEP